MDAERSPSPPLALSYREAARLLKIDRRATLHALIEAGRLRSVPWGRWRRIPLEDMQRLAREGFTIACQPVRARRRASPAPVAGRIADLDVDDPMAEVANMTPDDRGLEHQP